MATAPDPDEVLRSTCGKDNFQRLARLLISGGTTLLREVFDQICQPSNLPTILNNPATKKQLKAAKLTKPQWDCLYPSPGVFGKSADFDVTLLFRLLRTICNLIPPATGWDALPTSTDHSLAANLARIKYYRNEVYSHVNQSMEITDYEFPHLWQEISDALVGIAGQTSPKKKHEWKVAIFNSLKNPLTAEAERNVQELLEWYRNDIDVKKSIEQLKCTIQEVQEGMERLESSAHVIETTVLEEAQDIKDRFREELGSSTREVHEGIKRLESSAQEGFQGTTHVIETATQDIKDQLGEMHQSIDRLGSSASAGARIRLRIDCETMSGPVQPGVSSEVAVTSQEREEGVQDTRAVPIVSRKRKAELSGVSGVTIENDGLPSPEKVLGFIALKSFQPVDSSKPEELNGFIEYMEKVRKVLIVDTHLGSLIITVECISLEILDELWNDYCTGHLSKIAQNFLVTEDVLKELGLTELKLMITILEEEYRASREIFLQGSSAYTSSNSEVQMEKGKSKAGNDVHRPANRSAERILRNSEKVKDGSPSIYKLPTEIALKREKSKIVRKSIGSPSNVVSGGTEKVLMVVGATGAGKTTLINGMVNYILGVEWKDDFRYKLVIEDDKGSQANSQTKDITAYTFYPMDGCSVPYTFTIIDTPGFGDTEGLQRDRQITDQIKEFFSIPPPDGIDHLDGIGFVTQASLARLTPTQEYIFDSILSIFGKDVVKNIFMLVTFADGQLPPVMDAIKKAKIPSQKYYKFNNSALFAENTEETEDSFDAMFWKMVVRSFKNFFAEFEKSESVSLQLTQEVLEEREQLQTLIEGLNPQITMGLSKIEEMRQEENVLKQRETEIETNKSFTYKVEVTKPREISLRGTGQHTTTCLRCNFTCHKCCSRADDSDKRQCRVMGSDGNCKVCPRHCHWTNHRNLPYLIEYETVTETRTVDDLKQKYDTAVSGKNKVKGMIEQLEDYLLNVHTTVMKMIVQAQQSLRRLDEIALKPNPLTQLQYLELLIKSEKNEAKPGWQKRVQYYEEAKRQAEMLSKVKDVKAAEKEINEKVRSGDKWYSRFKFW